jgi:hypothetical protein
VASLSADNVIFRRFKTGSSQLGVYDNGFYEVLVTLNSTLVPGHGSMTFSNVNNFPVVDRGGLDVAFRGNGSGSLAGLYKRVDGGAEQVVDTTVVPGGADSGAGDRHSAFRRGEHGAGQWAGGVLAEGLITCRGFTRTLAAR